MMDLRTFVVATLYVVFIRQFWVAVSTFTIIRSEPPSIQRLVIPASMFILFRVSRSISPNPAFVVIGCIVAALSLALLEWSRVSIHGKFFSYLFSNDVPGFLWTRGPYAYVRNPFYTSYLLAYASAAVMLPSPATVLLFVGMAAYYWMAARKEEHKFERSALAGEYEAYKRLTGRFVPRFRRP